jgi:DNA-binding MarR family transcriptional regulator
VSRASYPLTPRQARILSAVGEASRALKIATRSGLPVEGMYTELARLVGRRLLSKSGRRPPTYRLTAEGGRLLRASVAYLESLQEAAS